MVYLLLVFAVLRVGDASHPGPAADESAVVLGVANPTGLHSQATYGVEHMAYGDLWAIGEPHLSFREVFSFNSGVRFAASSYQPMLGGYPVPHAQANTGCWMGVGVLSNPQVRHLLHSWPEAYNLRERGFRALLACHDRACRFVAVWHAVLLQVLWSGRRKVLGQPAQAPTENYPVATDVVPGWTPLLCKLLPPVGASRWYGLAVVSMILDWFWGVVGPAAGPVVRVSNELLYVDYALTTGDAGPIHLQGRQDGAVIPLHTWLVEGFRAWVRWFGRVLRVFLKLAWVPGGSRSCCPASHMICMHASCMGLPLAAARLCAAVSWLARFSRASFWWLTRELGRLPVPPIG